jgi:PHP family Zn ribbon phosphoesterase
MSHKIESAPTGRASCRGCKETIAKGVTRFCEEFANPYSEDGGKSFRYWHLACAATKLANELAPVLSAYEPVIEDRASIEALIAEHMRPPMPHAEHAPNGRARCRACDESIAKGELRVAFERTFDGPMGPQKGAAYTHARCLPRYLEREKERGSETVEPQELFRQIEAHSAPGAGAKVDAEDLTAVRTALGL